MSEWIRTLLDLALIGVVAAGLVQASRLIQHLAGLRQGRIDMERFVHEFNATVMRAEAGIKGLRQAARDTGDDLEKLVEKGSMVRDELHILVESADQIAERLSKAATTKAAEPKAAPQAKSEPQPAAETATTVTPMTRKDAAPSSRAEKELLQALQKLS
ncbi:MAG: DUF6468 domain-containing protein [Alphaproteobacteria bacterium]